MLSVVITKLHFAQLLGRRDAKIDTDRYATYAFVSHSYHGGNIHQVRDHPWHRDTDAYKRLFSIGFKTESRIKSTNIIRGTLMLKL